MLEFFEALQGLIHYIYNPFYNLLTEHGIDMNVEWFNGWSYDFVFFTILSFVVYFFIVFSVIRLFNFLASLITGGLHR